MKLKSYLSGPESQDWPGSQIWHFFARYFTKAPSSVLILQSLFAALPASEVVQNIQDLAELPGKCELFTPMNSDYFANFGKIGQFSAFNISTTTRFWEAKYTIIPHLRRFIFRFRFGLGTFWKISVSFRCSRSRSFLSWRISPALGAFSINSALLRF